MITLQAKAIIYTLENAFKQYMESIKFKHYTADPYILVTSEVADLAVVAVYVDN